MEVLFENRYVRNEAMMKEYLRRSHLCNPIAIAVYIVTAIHLVTELLIWVRWGFALSPVDLIYLLFPVALYVGYRRTLKLILNRDLEVNGGKPVEVLVTVTETGISGQTQVDAPEILYSSMKKVRQTRNLIIIYTKSRLALLVPKYGFTKGTAEELLQFLRAKGLKVR